MSENASIIAGDCRLVVPTLGKFDLVFADPPANAEVQEFNAFTADWIQVCWKACRGIFVVHGDDDLAERCLLESRRRRMNRISWVNWAYRPRKQRDDTWPDARRHCLVFGRNRHTWNPEAVCHVSELGRRWMPGTVWGEPTDGKCWGPVDGHNYERWRKSPGQLPELYLERLINAYTNPGDRILDPFGGSGTTAVVAATLRRDCVTIEQSESKCKLIRERLEFGASRV